MHAGCHFVVVEDRRQIFKAHEQSKENTTLFLQVQRLVFCALVSRGCSLWCPIKQKLQLECCPGLDHFIACPSCTYPWCWWVGPAGFLPHHQVTPLSHSISQHGSIKWASSTHLVLKVKAGGQTTSCPDTFKIKGKREALLACHSSIPTWGMSAAGMEWITQGKHFCFSSKLKKPA